MSKAALRPPIAGNRGPLRFCSRCNLKTLVIDIGGTHVKVWKSRRNNAVRISSGRILTPLRLIERIKEIEGNYRFDRVSLGYPGQVIAGRPVTDPINLCAGWVDFDYWNAFGCPLRIMNDACMQALGSYAGGRMLYLGLGTGIGTAFISDGFVVPLALGHLEFLSDSFDDWLSAEGLRLHGAKHWTQAAFQAAAELKAAFLADYVVFGGGYARKLVSLPEYCRKGGNHNAYLGGLRMWEDAYAHETSRVSEPSRQRGRS
jgi:hypothetical protein